MSASTRPGAARRHTVSFALLAALALAFGVPAHAADPIKVGLALDISGPFAAGGAETRDAINLAVKLLGNKLGGEIFKRP